MCMNIVMHTGMAGKDQLADAVLGGAADYIGDIAAILSKMFYASEQERVSRYGDLEGDWNRGRVKAQSITVL